MSPSERPFPSFIPSYAFSPDWKVILSTFFLSLFFPSSNTKGFSNKPTEIIKFVSDLNVGKKNYNYSEPIHGHKMKQKPEYLNIVQLQFKRKILTF